MYRVNIYNWIRGFREVLDGMTLAAPQIGDDGHVTLEIRFPTVELYADWIVKRSEAKRMLDLDDGASELQ